MHAARERHQRSASSVSERPAWVRVRVRVRVRVTVRVRVRELGKREARLLGDLRIRARRLVRARVKG